MNYHLPAKFPVEAPVEIVHRIIHQRAEEKGEELVVLTQVLAHDPWICLDLQLIFYDGLLSSGYSEFHWVTQLRF